jgi:TldD protein
MPHPSHLCDPTALSTGCRLATHERLAIAQDCLLSPFELNRDQLHKALGLIAKHRVDDADLYFQYTCSEAWFLEEGIVKTGNFAIDQGVGLRAVCGEKTAFAYSDDISWKALKEAAQTVRSIAQQGQNAHRHLPPVHTAKSHRLYAPHNPIRSLSSQAKVALLEKLERYAKACDPRVEQVMASLAAQYEVVLIARLDGTLAADVRPLVRLGVQVIVAQNGQRESGSSGGGGRLNLDLFDDTLLKTYAQEAVDVALTNLEAQPAPAGLMSVVLGPGWPGILLHEAIGHGLEGDFNRKGSSAFSGRLGQRVAAKGVTVVDDGTLAGRRGSLNVDDEGCTTQCTVLIEDGILKGYLQDQLNARLMKVPPTGNGRRESYAHLPLPRMTTTYMQAGSHEPQDIIASMDKGVYATHFGGGQVDITSGKFVFSASQAFWVEKGKICYPIKGASLIGNGPDALTRVTMIGKDLALDSGVGTCGKEGQSVPVGVGQPTVRIEGLTVGGTRA